MTNAVNIAGLGAALTVSSNVVNFSSTPTVAGSPIGASAATPTAAGTVFGKTTSSGTENCAGGYQALNVATGIKNCAFGTYSGFQITSGTLNTLVGGNSGGGMTTGSNNVGVGFQSLASLTTKTHNVAIGYQALYNTNEDANTAVGSFSLTSNSSGYYNTAMGYESLKALTTGIGNVSVGFQAGSNLATGNYGMYIGYGSTASSSSVGYEMVLCTTAGSVTGKGSSTAFISVGGGSIYQGNNSSSWATTSDRRLKKNIVDNNEGLDKIAQIKVRNFEYRTEKEITELPTHAAIQKTGVQLGVIAQELQEVCPDCVKTESTGVLRVDSDNIFWHMVNAIKDLKALNDTLTARITALEAR